MFNYTGNLPQVPLCQLPGCKLPCFADANNTFLKFCGKNHKQSMEKRGMLCYINGSHLHIMPVIIHILYMYFKGICI